MALYIDVKVNERVVATARVRNIAPDDRDVCDYEGEAETKPIGDRGRYGHELKIVAHDRRHSVWRLVEKIAGKLAQREARRP